MILKSIAYALSFLSMMALAEDPIELNWKKNRVEAEGILSVSANWVQIHGRNNEKFDIQLNLRNLLGKSLIIRHHHLKCFRENNKSQLFHRSFAMLGEFYPAGEHTIRFAPKEEKTLTMTCNHGGKDSGDFRVQILRIYSDPLAPESDAGKMLARNLTWQYD